MLINAEKVSEILNTSQSSAYRVIRKLNKELEDKGYLTLRGRIPKDYLKERYRLEIAEE